MAATWAVPGLFYFAREWMFKNSRRPSFTIFVTMRLGGDKKIREIWIFFFFPQAGTVEEIT